MRIFAPDNHNSWCKDKTFLHTKQIFSIPKKFFYGNVKTKKKHSIENLVELSQTEWQIAEEYCHGLTDKEVSEKVKKPLWTIKTHKRNIFRKLGVNTTHEMVIYCIAYVMNIDWSTDIVRIYGLTMFI